METLSIIRLFYVMYTVYTLFVMSVSNYNFFHYLSSFRVSKNKRSNLCCVGVLISP